MGNVGNAAHNCEVQQQLKFALSTNILATDWPLNQTVITQGLLWYD